MSATHDVSGPATVTVPQSRPWRHILNSWRAEIGVGLGLIFLIVLFSAIAPNFASSGNASSILRQVSVTAIVAVGMTMVIIAGEIDLSVGASVGLAGTLFALLVVQHNVPMVLSFVCVLIVSAIIGLFIGSLRVIWGIPSFITTIGLLSALRGIAFLISNSLTIGPLPASLPTLWFGAVLGVPIPILLMIAVALAGWVTLGRTRFGRHLYALGGNPVTASRYGIPVPRMRLYVFVIVQCLAAVGGVLYVARLNGGSATVGELLELDVIAAVIVGGTSLSGGVGRMIGTMLGVLFVAVLRNGMVLLGVDPIVFMIAQGFVIILAVWWGMLHRTGWNAE
ncbi:monosaccharide ABC transporter membrane protein, CUT2 family [Faunimonas pinastri]|uniref:Monosaccharide ABC transporter membrane protein, CUT2 family n=1 Tax=Faunimonas pinastri TaxID=1855383 RepID=A0A1H9EJI3_9HYPH|nr:ABC transporter permease [Faunimonas pinastri]SEQ25874.1 monosaccharide ABC transporter membrane protein, CUT2 family [Faunimonas pinastri]